MLPALLLLDGQDVSPGERSAAVMSTWTVPSPQKKHPPAITASSSSNSSNYVSLGGLGATSPSSTPPRTFSSSRASQLPLEQQQNMHQPPERRLRHPQQQQHQQQQLRSPSPSRAIDEIVLRSQLQVCSGVSGKLTYLGVCSFYKMMSPSVVAQLQ